ncbi:MAG: hypothetical protein IJF59_02885 [Clostridia bacterium]|nr:hypothetical protein [Clostridia bacterium]MBQ3078156.1 hypothetical protein [Clostridia bacterium]
MSVTRNGLPQDADRVRARDPQMGDAGIVLPDLYDGRRPGYNYMDPHRPVHVGEPKRFPEITNEAVRYYGEPHFDA